MKKTLLLLSFVFCATFLSAQCSELFFSEYVEGYSNNKALEIYNPTSEAINLSAYSLVRFSNGATTAPDEKVIQLPDEMLAPYDVYVVIVDLTDVTQWNSTYDKPVWNGYNVIDTLFDSVSELPILDDDGNVVFGPQYTADGAALFQEDVYTEKWDLQCKADVFLCPDYDTNNVMYFNGNDAMALISGTEVAIDGSNLIDVIGVIGEDPTSTIGEDAWIDVDGYWLTKNHTLVRNPDVAGGRNALTDIVYQSGGTFLGEEWVSNFNNSFQFLGVHESDCNTTTLPDEVSCDFVLSTAGINEVEFRMYPNPTTGALTIEAEENITQVAVHNLMGQLLMTQSYDVAQGIATVDLQNVISGMYTVSLTFTDKTVSIQKVIVK